MIFPLQQNEVMGNSEYKRPVQEKKKKERSLKRYLDQVALACSKSASVVIDSMAYVV